MDARHPCQFTLLIYVLKGVTPGSYYWAVGLVDTTKDNAIGLEMAVPENMLNAGWAKLQEVTVR